MVSHASLFYMEAKQVKYAIVFSLYRAKHFKRKCVLYNAWLTATALQKYKAVTKKKKKKNTK